jgi:hypothetical protein
MPKGIYDRSKVQRRKKTDTAPVVTEVVTATPVVAKRKYTKRAKTQVETAASPRAATRTANPTAYTSATNETVREALTTLTALRNVVTDNRTLVGAVDQALTRAVRNYCDSLFPVSQECSDTAGNNNVGAHAVHVAPKHVELPQA